MTLAAAACISAAPALAEVFGRVQHIEKYALAAIAAIAIGMWLYHQWKRSAKSSLRNQKAQQRGACHVRFSTACEPASSRV